jgi:hypothetical protein
MGTEQLLYCSQVHGRTYAELRAGWRQQRRRFRYAVLRGDAHPRQGLHTCCVTAPQGERKPRDVNA